MENHLVRGSLRYDTGAVVLTPGYIPGLEIARFERAVRTYIRVAHLQEVVLRRNTGLRPAPFKITWSRDSETERY